MSGISLYRAQCAESEIARLKAVLRQTLEMLHDALAENGRLEELVKTQRRALTPETQL